MGRLVRHRAIRERTEPGRGAGVRIERSYDYDPAGNLGGVLDKLRGQQNYRYDLGGRILSATGRQEEFFDFDPASNIMSHIPGGMPGKVDGNRAKVFEDLRIEFDANGDVATRRRGAHEEAEFHWDADHQLVQANVWRSGVTQTIKYEYDALKRRISKSDAFGRTEYLWDGDLMVESRRGERAALFVFEPQGFAPLATIQDGNIYWYQCDQIGTPLELTSGDGDIVWAADYRVWGEATLRKIKDCNPHLDNVDAGRERNHVPPPLIDQPFRFQGQQFDEETGLHYNRHRYYDPAMGRFLTQDPIGLAGGMNLYQYAPNPIGWLDPFGLKCDGPAEKLNRKLSALEGAQSSAVRTRTLIDGRIRYYNKELLARTTGPTRGGSYVTEWNPATGQVRSWLETYDQSGQVNRVHPKMANGEALDLPHYPPTKSDVDQGKATESGRALHCSCRC